MNELIFIVEEAPEGGYQARALGESIFAEGDTLEALHRNVRDAVQCHFDADELPETIRLRSSEIQQLLESDFIGCAEGSADLSTNYKQFLFDDPVEKHGSS